MKKSRVLVVAISPPPYGGQALMVQSMLDAQYQTELYHVRMSFSDSMSSMGKVGFKKIIHMLEIVARSLSKKWRFGIPILYYVPGGSSTAPIVRDIFILFFLRLAFRHVIFHFHAAGISEVVQSLPAVIRSLARWVYRTPDLTIHLSARNPDKHFFKGRYEIIIPNGLKDKALNYLPIERRNRTPQLLFVGVLQESKGVKVLLEAVSKLQDKGLPFQITFVGEFVSSSFELEMRSFCRDKQIEDRVTWAGVNTGDAKWARFAHADIFCFPSFFEAESFGNVVVEAMMFELPVVATSWRGIPDIVDDGQTGLLIPVRDSCALADKLSLLINDAALRTQMGKCGRRKFLQHYQIDTFINRMDDAFQLVVQHNE